MKIRKIKFAVFAIICAFGLIACDKPHPAESAGKELDKAAENAGEKMDQAGEKLSEQKAKTEVALDDSAITAKVKGDFLAASEINSMNINVDTVNGTVTLTGKIDTQANKDRVQQIASAVSNVKEVRNQLEVRQ